MPGVLKQAVLATEDRDFYEHGGVDPVGIARALYNDLRGRGVQQGGSTITQQYVKNVYLTSERSITRKIKEAVLAVKLERELDKDEILERYLNTIYFGRGAYGVGAASRAYFGKDVRDIGLPEASYLAGLIRSPGGADALEHPEEAARRRGTVLDGDGRGAATSAPSERAAIDASPIETGVVDAQRPHRARPGRGRRSTTTSAPSTSSRRCASRSPSSTARTRSTAAACGSTPPSTSTCSGRRGTRSPSTLDRARATPRRPWWPSTSTAR